LSAGVSLEEMWYWAKEKAQNVRCKPILRTAHQFSYDVYHMGSKTKTCEFRIHKRFLYLTFCYKLTPTVSSYNRNQWNQPTINSGLQLFITTCWRDRAHAEAGQSGAALAGNCQSSCPVLLRQTGRFVECRYASYWTLSTVHTTWEDAASCLSVFILDHMAEMTAHSNVLHTTKHRSLHYSVYVRKKLQKLLSPY